MKYILTEEQIKNNFKKDRWCELIEEIVKDMDIKSFCGVDVKMIESFFGDELLKYYLTIVKSDVRNKEGYGDKIRQNVNNFLPHIEVIVTILPCGTPVKI